MKLLDSNILIYAPQPAFNYLRVLLVDEDVAVSEISILEVLGYHKLNLIEKKYFEVLFNTIKIIPIDREIILKATELRQQKRLSLGDAIHAATSIIYNCEFYTRNISDFDSIAQLKIINPIQ